MSTAETLRRGPQRLVPLLLRGRRPGWSVGALAAMSTLTGEALSLRAY